MALAVLLYQTGTKLKSNDKKPVHRKMSSKRKQLNRKAIKTETKKTVVPRKTEETNALSNRKEREMCSLTRHGK